MSPLARTMLDVVEEYPNPTQATVASVAVQMRNDAGAAKGHPTEEYFYAGLEVLKALNANVSQVGQTA